MQVLKRRKSECFTVSNRSLPRSRAWIQFFSKVKTFKSFYLQNKFDAKIFIFQLKNKFPTLCRKFDAYLSTVKGKIQVGVVNIVFAIAMWNFASFNTQIFFWTRYHRSGIYHIFSHINWEENNFFLYKDFRKKGKSAFTWR